MNTVTAGPQKLQTLTDSKTKDKKFALLSEKVRHYYSSNKIRMAENEHLIIMYQNLNYRLANLE